jgi:hypothetical protein
MTKQDWPEFNLLLGEIALAFRSDINQETIRVYGKHLADYPLEAIQFATSKAIQTGERFPLVKTLRELAGSYRTPPSRQPVTDFQQLPEFSEQAVEESKQKLADLIAGVSVSSG